jgi:hypothetical protein
MPNMISRKTPAMILFFSFSFMRVLLFMDLGRLLMIRCTRIILSCGAAPTLC